MQIDSSLSGYNYQRVRDVEKTGGKPNAAEEQAVKRGPGNPTVSSTVLSTSLANMLWAVGSTNAPGYVDVQAHASAEDKAEAQAEWVRSAYSEHSGE
ncbi:hypothetical protein [Agrobacterium tumefaciens]|uniref:hypothetical protein n=1 Tax=Agrobacterium tumefaciens TaxID=358 RepID=UPI00287CAD4F|nr:hypothetical protein [Agrobacterium tumefaciens]MDS7596478.1 hypothetical protein [Agrobacterium tumefaciens]